MKRAPRRPQTLKHLPFFEVLAAVPEGSPEAKLATAGLLSLRMIDHWVLAGPAIVEPESVSVRSVRQAIMALEAREPLREALLTIVNTMQMLRQVDLVPVLPRVFAYAELLDRHHSGATALAADTYESVIRLADPEFDADLIMDAYQRLAICQRKMAALDDAFESSTLLVKLASKKKDRARALRGKIGLAHVAMLRGDLASADSQFVAVAVEAEKHNLSQEFAMATHNRGVVAFRAGKPVDAVVLSHRALKRTTDPVDRDRILADLSAFLIKLEQYDAATDALRILELTAVSDEPRQAAKVNLLSVAARQRNRERFDSARRELIGASLPVEARVNALIETGRGLALFGESAEAIAALESATAEAAKHGLQRSVDEVDALLRAMPGVLASPAVPHPSSANPAPEVLSDLRRMAAELEPAA